MNIREKLNRRDVELMWTILGYRKEGKHEEADVLYSERVGVWAALDKLNKGYEPLDDEALAKAEDYNYYDSVATEKLEGWEEE